MILLLRFVLYFLAGVHVCAPVALQMCLLVVSLHACISFSFVHSQYDDCVPNMMDAQHACKSCRLTGVITPCRFWLQ